MDEDRYIRITLRLPKELHEILGAEADISSKSLNAEIVARLQKSLRADVENHILLDQATQIWELRRQLMLAHLTIRGVITDLESPTQISENVATSIFKLRRLNQKTAADAQEVLNVALEEMERTKEAVMLDTLQAPKEMMPRVGALEGAPVAKESVLPVAKHAGEPASTTVFSGEQQKAFRK